MERRIYLVRHGEPDLGDAEGRVYLGRKDVSLLEKNKEICRRLGNYFRRIKIDAVVSSPLLRCRQTTDLIMEGMQSEYPVRIMDAFQEVDTGLWDGKTFREIREAFPEEYEDRGRHPGRKVFPDGESLEEAGKRFARGLELLISETQGSLIVVAHAGVIRAFLCLISGRDIDQLIHFRIPYASITELIYNGTFWHAECIGFCPAETMTKERVNKFWNICRVSEDQQKHMRKTAELALQLIGYDPRSKGDFYLESEYAFGGTILNTNIIYYGGLLHDIMRSVGRGHEEIGAEWMDEKGFPEIARVIRLHNNPAVLRENRPLDEAEIIYYADKRVKGERILTLDERFTMSMGRITTREGREMFEKRLEAAKKIEEKLLDIIDNRL